MKLLNKKYSENSEKLRQLTLAEKARKQTLQTRVAALLGRQPVKLLEK